MTERHFVMLKDRMRGLIAQSGPMTVAQFMALALHDPLAGYYARRAMLGADGDFITAPEVSQIFGELIGLWCAHEWDAVGRATPLKLIELGPGTGALMRDALRAAKSVAEFSAALDVHCVEASDVLRAAQESALFATWHARLEEVPHGGALIVANEFLDCMPVRQFVRARDGWRERLVGVGDGEALVFGLAPAPLPTDALIPPALRDAPEGSVAEIAPTLPAFVAHVAARLNAHPGRALFIDYGDPETRPGNTLQAVRRHARVDPLDDPGSADLTAHVDFATLAARARAEGLDVAGPVTQGDWLPRLGIEARAAALARANPERADVIARQVRRLTHAEEMGVLFQVICLSSPGLPAPAGFAP